MQGEIMGDEGEGSVKKVLDSQRPGPNERSAERKDVVDEKKVPGDGGGVHGRHLLVPEENFVRNVRVALANMESRQNSLGKYDPGEEGDGDEVRRSDSRETGTKAVQERCEG